MALHSSKVLHQIQIDSIIIMYVSLLRFQFSFGIPAKRAVHFMHLNFICFVFAGIDFVDQFCIHM